MQRIILQWALFIILFVTEIWGLTNIKGLEYQITLEHEEIFSPCKDYPDNYITDILDISNLDFKYISKTNIHVSGDIIVTKKFSKTPIQLDAQVYKKRGADWINTVYNMKRSDFCQALWEKNEFWHKFTTSIAKAKQKCPLDQNLVIHIDADSELTMDVPDRKLDGDYKGEIKLYAADEWFVCFEIAFTATKK